MSKKQKNTYILSFNTLINKGIFSMCKATPVPLIYINGEKQESNTGWIKTKDFPNPSANEMAQRYIENAQKMGDKIATTVIEYLDKDTKQPVLQLYPTTIHIFSGYEQNYKSHLNHATRRDLDKEIKKRVFIDKYINRMK